MMQLPKTHPSLAELQAYVADAVVERGFADETVSEMFMLFLEECGELAKAARKAEGAIKTDQSSRHFDLGTEAADVFSYLLDICNHFNIDLETAFREKEAINNKRTWQ